MKAEARRPLRAVLLAAGGSSEDLPHLDYVVRRVAARPVGLRRRFAEAELVVTEAYEVRLPGPAAVVELAAWLEEQERSPPPHLRRRTEGQRQRWTRRRRRTRRQRTC